MGYPRRIDAYSSRHLGVVYRLRAGPLESRAASDELCEKLKERSVGCFVIAPSKGKAATKASVPSMKIETKPLPAPINPAPAGTPAAQGQPSASPAPTPLQTPAPQDRKALADPKQTPKDKEREALADPTQTQNYPRWSG